MLILHFILLNHNSFLLFLTHIFYVFLHPNHAFLRTLVHSMGLQDVTVRARSLGECDRVSGQQANNSGSVCPEEMEVGGWMGGCYW